MAWRGATVAIAVVTAGLWAWFVGETITPASLLAPLLVGLGGLVLAVAAGVVAALVLRLLRVRAVPAPFVIVVVAALPLLEVMTRAGLGNRDRLALALLLLGACGAAGAAIGALATGGWSGRSPPARAFLAASLALGGGALLGGAVLLAWEGAGTARIPALGPAQARERALDLPDPFAPGPFRVERLTYGAGGDRHREEFADGAALRTQAVDGSRLLPGWSGLTARTRESFWGFGAGDLPLNGRVWYPANAPGRLPLVLIVHGDHAAADFSDGGYAYLAGRLASRGHIAVSVDENFLNSSVGDLSALGIDRFALDDEMPARAWLLLEHLRVWRAWSERPGHRFQGRVDLGRVALVGHSRGGEAVALAAAFNRLPAFPDDRAQRFDYGFGIRAVAALAPTEGRYRPGGRAVGVGGASLLVLGGSHDGDVRTFAGPAMVRRARPPRDGLAAAVFVHRANHSQFNSSWGRHDVGLGAARRLIATEPLLVPAQQRRIAGVYVSAFLDATLRARREYLPLFRQPGAGSRWLPRTAYVAEYRDGAATPVVTADEDRDLRTTTDGGRAAGAGLTEWREEGGDDRAVALAWRRRGASYAVALGPGAGRPGSRGEVVFALADAGAAERPVDLTVEVRDGDGTVARTPLGRQAPLEPAFSSQRLKVAALEPDPANGPVFQTYALSLARAAAADPAFDARAVREVRFVFDRTPGGRVLLDDVAVRDGGA